MTIQRVAYFVILTAAFISSCTKENIDDCYGGLRLKFEFSFNVNGEHQLNEKVHRARVYLFDENDVLQLYAVDDGINLEYTYLQDGQVKTVIKPNPCGDITDDYVMNLDQAPPGKYRIISFAGSGTNGSTTFFHGHMNDPLTHDFVEGVILGVTTTTDFRLFIDYDIADNLPEDVVPKVDEINDLFYGAVGTRDPITARYIMDYVEIKSNEITNRNIDLICNTNILKVTVSGLEYLGMRRNDGRGVDLRDFKLWVRARNGRYKYDDTAGENARSVRYTPHVAHISNNIMLADVKVLRLDMEGRHAEPMYLYFESPDGAQFPQGGIDVVNTLLQARDSQGNYVYTKPADFVKIYEHPIDIRISEDLSVKIYINGWEVIDIKAEV